MVTIRTDLGSLRESARRIRVEEDGLNGPNVQVALEGILENVSGALEQRTVTSSGGLPIVAGDEVLNITTTSGFTAVTIPTAASRNGVAIILQDKAASWAANNPVFSRTGSDSFDGATSLTGKINYGQITLRPYDDGTGYKVSGVWQ